MMAQSGGGGRLATLPNALTVLRLLCVPILIALLAAPSAEAELTRNAAAVVFVLASITDILDGRIARRRGQVSAFGTLADPIADKALVGTTLVGLSLLGALPWWVTAVIVIREVGVTVLRLWVLRQGIIPASRGGKFKTVMQTIAITMYLMVLPPGMDGTDAGQALDLLRMCVMGIAILLTVITGIDYVARALRLRRQAQAAAG